MRPYNSGNCIGRDEEDYNNIFLGHPNRYNSFDLDYVKNIKPYLIKKNIEYISSRLHEDNVIIVSREMGLNIINEYFLPIFSKCFVLDWVTPEQVKTFSLSYKGLKGFHDLLDKLKEKNTLSGVVADFEDFYRTKRIFKNLCDNDGDKPDCPEKIIDELTHFLLRKKYATE